MRKIALLLASFIALAACEPAPTASTTGTDGTPSQKIYRISALNESKIQFRMLDSVNALRAAAGAAELKLNASLNASAATHARDMSVQNRPWHFGSDGSSPVLRAQRSGYKQSLLGENISESYETELQTLAAWMELPATRDVILDPKGRDMGFSWFQDPAGKIWWVLNVGGVGAGYIQAPSPVAERAQG